MRTQLFVAVAIFMAVGSTAPSAQTVRPVQEFSLTDTQGLITTNVTAEAAEFLGRKAVRLANPKTAEGFALLSGTDFQDGTIDMDVAVKVTTPVGVRNPGFIGFAFRARPDGSHYDMFYIRPGNAGAEDQARRNHVAQYSATPNYAWYQLRWAWPWVYESHADIRPDAWTHMKVTVAGRVAKLYLNGSTEPTLVVDGMKGELLRGGVLLFGYQGEEAYFSNVRITNSPPQPVKNDSDAAGAWTVKTALDAGLVSGTLQLTRTGDKLSGSWSGDLGQNLPVTGTWRDGYVELSFTGELPKAAGGGPAVTRLAGWIDGDTGKGRARIETRADGTWTATKKQ